MNNLTTEQAERLVALERTQPGGRFCTSRHKGATIVNQMRRYLQREDAEEIKQALYRFSP